MRRTALALFSLLLAAGAGEAHDLWLESSARGLTLYHGHPPGLAHDDSAPKEAPIETVLRVDCFGLDASGESRDSIAGYPVDFGEGCPAACALLSSGYWTKTPYGMKNVPKNEATQPLSSWLSFESVKRIERWSDAFAEPLTADLEIVPLHDPFALRDGDKLRLLLTLEGKPVPGAIVLYDGRPRGETDADGLVNIRLRRAGIQLIVASLRTPLASEKADETVRTATLVFDLEEKE